MARSVIAIKKKYGANAFKRWGVSGSSPILKAWRQGKIPRYLVYGKSNKGK